MSFYKAFSAQFSQSHSFYSPSINYIRAFDQGDINNRYRKILIYKGCSENVFKSNPPDTIQEKKNCDADYLAYKRECLHNLNREKNWAKLEHTRTNLVVIFSMWIALKIVNEKYKTSQDTKTSLGFGSEIAFNSFIFSTVTMVTSIVYELFNFFFTPRSPLDDLETDFAENQCFIPHQIWPSIIKHFALSRQNIFAQEKSLKFLEFALSLQTFHRTELVGLKKGIINNNTACNKISLNIDRFFKKYKRSLQENETHFKERDALKTIIQDFFFSLVGRGNIKTRYIYLQGKAGIGKTYFVNKIAEWLNEVLNTTVFVDQYTITRPDELEGSDQQPGILLKALSKKCKRKSPGSIIFLDEAEWINTPCFVSSAKRTFNGDQTQIATGFFGLESDGSQLKLSSPPTIILLSGNTPISDEAIKSRFQIINFPHPTQKTLLSFGYEKINEIKRKFFADTTIDPVYFKKEIQKLHTFREVENMIPEFFQKSISKTARPGEGN
ncbi:MAG: hypothetical protein HEEMFOPI_01644 [Holosporales bacterium]